ncbi:MAG: hypothetical protein WBK46_10985 [Ruminococcus flavefaciens]
MDGKTLRDIYEYDLIPDVDTQNILDEWFNSIMNKELKLRS